MNLLSVNNLSKSYGVKHLFSNISFGIGYGEKVALVARNGTGKSTLFKILKGIEIADKGNVVFRKNIRISFLDQDFILEEEKTVQQALRDSDNPIVKCIRRYDAAVAAAEKNPGHESATILDDAIKQMNQLEAWNYEKDMADILSRLGVADLSQKISTLSGGQKKRVALAQTLISKPDLVFMDEPTNHLDIDMIEWLEHYLKDQSISLLLVTHDRYFLDAVCDRILELDGGNLFEYRGDFQYYLDKKAEREAAENTETEKAKNLYRRELEWIRKMPKARGTKAKARVDAFAEIEQKARKRRKEENISLSVKMERLGSRTVELHRVTKKYNDKIILKPFTYTFIPGEKVGVIGMNGVGKSTLARIILGETEIDSGKVQVGETVKFGHYSQSGINPGDDKRIIEVVRGIAEHIPMANGTSLSASQLLSRFNFQPSVQYSFVSTLSGGEKRRLYLLTILMANPNFLILDEPTNDLDIVTIQTLEEFLDDFGGCVLIISHDRHFMDRLVSHTFIFEGDGEVSDFPGNYSEYRIWKQERSAVEKSAEKPSVVPVKEEADAVKDKSGKKLSFKIKHELKKLESEIPKLEKRKSELEGFLSSGLEDYKEIQRLSEELNALTRELDSKSMRWLEIQEEME